MLKLLAFVNLLVVAVVAAPWQAYAMTIIAQWYVPEWGLTFQHMMGLALLRSLLFLKADPKGTETDWVSMVLLAFIGPPFAIAMARALKDIWL